jgi:predicted O-methyltransferase YrrM
MTDKFERYRQKIPELVRQAMSLAEELGFPLMPEGRPAGYQGPPSACIPEVGRLLSVLAAGYPNGKVAEFGRGAGVGTGWLLHGLPATSRLFSAEKDRNLVTRTRKLFEKYPNVDIRQGDCFEVLQDEMPFDLLFSDVGIRQVLKPENWDTFTEMVNVGGKIVFDDLLPIELWPPAWDDLVDEKREFAYRNPRIIGTEIRTTSSQVAIIVTRIS